MKRENGKILKKNKKGKKDITEKKKKSRRGENKRQSRQKPKRKIANCCRLLCSPKLRFPGARTKKTTDPARDSQQVCRIL